MAQIITIQTDGTVSGLQVKPGKGVNLQKLARDIGVKAATSRVSEILWSEADQAWFVQPIEGPFAGFPISVKMWQDMFGAHEFPEGSKHIGLPGNALLFEDYDLAVKCEIAFLDAHRAEGRF